MFIWIFAAIVVFLLSLVIAVVSVEKEKKIEASSDDDVREKGEGVLLSKPTEQPSIGHGEVVNVLEPAEAVEMIDDRQHSHEQITEEVPVSSVPALEDTDEIIPRYLEEEMNDREQSKKLAGEIDL